jgi:hypothetical protein
MLLENASTTHNDTKVQIATHILARCVQQTPHLYAASVHAQIVVACGGARALTMKRGGDVDRVCRVNKKGIDKELPSSRNVDDRGWVRQVRRHHRCMRPCDDGWPLRPEADAAW